MKIKSGFMLREIAGQWVIIPLGARSVEFNVIMTLSESGALLWKKLEKGSNKNELLAATLAEYAVDKDIAEADIDSFIQAIQTKGLLEQ